jgi:signal transduction histidine kinase
MVTESRDVADPVWREEVFGPLVAVMAFDDEEQAVALSPDLLGAVGYDGLLKLHNPSWGRSLKMDDAELQRTPFLDLIATEDRGRIERIVAGLADGTAADEFVCRLQRPVGGERTVLFSAQSCGADACFYVAGKDVTERQRLEDELAERAAVLERTNAELQDFAYIASHDLSEPLRMVTSYLELLEKRYGEQLDDTAREFIGYAVGGAVRMKDLIQDLLAYSRVGSHELQRLRVDLDELVSAVLPVLRRAIEEAHATVEVRSPLGVIVGDPTQIGQLLQNLVANALKFRSPEKPPVVTISSDAEPDGMRIHVADNGIGIDPAAHERIFKMFARLHGPDEYEGTGIGLALCRRIADRHDGNVWLDSEPGLGATFHVWLPGAA